MKILLPVDGSELSLQAVRMAITLLGQGLSGSVVTVGAGIVCFELSDGMP